MSKSVADIAAELQRLQRKRSIVIKSRIMHANRIQAVIAGTLGYSSGMEEKARRAKFKEAEALIKLILKGKANHEYTDIIRATYQGVESFRILQDDLEEKMLAESVQLPAAAWVEAPEQRGFGLLFLAIVVGEAGDLANYSNPAKLWRRFGCAPWTFDGHTAMGQTWRFEKYRPCKLPASEWEEFGYCKRRRSIAYLIGKNLMMQNGSRGGDRELDTDSGSVGPYRRIYDEKKAAAAVAHPDWRPIRRDLHAMLLATKRLLRNLWCYWNGKPEINELVAA